MANLKSVKPQYNDPLLQSLQYNELFIFLYPCYRKTYEMESRYNETIKQTLFYLSLGPLLLWGSTVREQNQINSGSCNRMSSLWNSPFACAMWMDPFSHENWKVWSRKCFCPPPPPSWQVSSIKSNLCTMPTLGFEVAGCLQKIRAVFLFFDYCRIINTLMTCSLIFVMEDC